MTPASEAASRVFISYAHKDGAALAQRLQTDLTNSGFTAWLDTQRLFGGDIWSSEIEHAIDDAEIAITLLSHGSYVSEVCRGEQLRSLRKGKCVIPIKVQTDCDIPIYLEAKQWLSFSTEKSYSEDRLKLIATIEKREGAVLKPEYRTTCNNAPGLLENLVRRPGVLASLRKQLFARGTNRNIALTALRGMGGIGKTVLAQELCHDDVVQQAFPDGIFWFTIGQDTKLDFVSRIQQVPALDRLLGEYKGEEACKSQYRDVLQKKATLIVLDDVWRASDIRPFYAESPRSRLLFTTRDASIAASFSAGEFKAELLTEDQSREVLRRWAGWPGEPLPAEAAVITHECGRLPLALSMIGASLHGEPSASWKGVADRLHYADLSLIEGDVGAYQHTSFLRAIQVSLEALENKRPKDREHYLALAPLLEDMEAPVEILSVLWGLDEFETRRVAKRLIDLSLAQRDGAERGLRLHDLQLDYVRKQHADQEALFLILEAMRLSRHIISVKPAEFASQMVGRLLSLQGRESIRKFSESLCEGVSRPWLRPFISALQPAGKALRATLIGHDTVIRHIALSADARVALSTTGATVKVWNVERGIEARTVRFPTVSVIAVTVDVDARQLAISSADGGTLLVWDLQDERVLTSLSGRGDDVRDVAMSSDGRILVSASDTSLKVWDAETGREIHTLERQEQYGCRRLAISGDGRTAVSSSFTTVKVWDVTSGHLLWSLERQAGWFEAVAISADGLRVFALSHSEFKCRLESFAVSQGRALCALDVRCRSAQGLAVTTDGQRAVVACDSTLRVWDLKNERVAKLSGHVDDIWALALSADGKVALSASGNSRMHNDFTIKVWDLQAVGDSTATDEPERINALAVSADGRHAVTASGTDLKVWDVESGRVLRVLKSQSWFVFDIALTANGRLAVLACRDACLEVWDVDEGKIMRTLSGHEEVVRSVAVSGDGRVCVSASDDHTVKVWDLEIGCLLRTLPGGFISKMAVSSDGSVGIWPQTDYANNRSKLTVWNLRTGQTLRDLESEGDIAISADGRCAISVSNSHDLILWDVETGQALRVLSNTSGRNRRLKDFALSSAALFAAMIYGDGSLAVWDLEKGSCIATSTCDAPATCCKFVHDRRILVTDELGQIHSFGIEL